MLIAALFEMFQICTQLKRPSTEERIKILWGIHTMEYYTATRKNKLQLHVAK